MIFSIHSQRLKLSVDTLGAQMMSIRSLDGTEYLWQGGAQYWADRAPVLFPMIGRLTNDTYKLHGKIYRMGIHGFAAASQFLPIQQGNDFILLELRSNDVTKLQYPFDFCLQILYSLQENVISVSYKVFNLSEETMPFAVGGHPGFRVPIEDGECFDDYLLEFCEPCEPDRVGFTSSVYLSGQDLVYPLVDKERILLRHDLFDQDAIILKNMAKSITLRSRTSKRGVTVSYPDQPYLGIWHWPKTDAPYVCIEPWSSLPSRQDIVEDIACKSDLLRLAPMTCYDTTWTITII